MKDKKEIEIQYIPVQCFPVNNSDENEIDLKELIKTILNYKKFIFLFVTLITVLSIYYAMFIAKPIYKVKAYIEPGYLKDKIEKKYIINPNALNLEIVNNFDNSKDKKNPFPIVKSQLVKGTRIIELTLENRSNLDAEKNLDKIFNYIKNKESNLSTAYINNIKKEIEILSNSKKEYLKEIKDYQKKLNKNNSQIFQDILDTISVDKKIILNIDTKIAKLTNSISPINIKNVHYVGKILIQDNPIKPEKRLVVIVAFITSLVLSIFLAFFIEFVKSLKEEK